MIRSTSLDAYNEIAPTLGKRQQLVLKAIKRASRAVSNRELAKYLGLEINQITPRVNELVKLGLVFADCKRVCRIGKRNAIHWRMK